MPDTISKPTTLTGTTGPADPSATLGQNNALPGQSYYDPSVSQIEAGQQKLGANAEGLLNYGLDQPGAAVPATLKSNDPMVTALSQRYTTSNANNTASLKAGNAAQAPVTNSSEQGAAASEANQVYQNQVSNFNQQYAYEMQRQNLYSQWQLAQSQATAGILGSIFSGIGAVGGAIIGGAVGGPAGAVAGAGAGSKL